MKQFLIVILVAWGSVASAQEDYVVTLEKDTLKGKVGLFRNTFYDEVEIKTDDGKQSFKSYQVLAVQKDESLYEPIVYENRRLIGRILTKGPLSHYAIMTEDSNGYGPEILLKKDGSTLQISNIGFRKRLMDFAAECIVLTNKLEDKTLPAADIAQVLSTYNRQCADAKMITQEVETKKEEEKSSDLQEFAQLIIDIQKKLDAGEKVPSYMVDALKGVDSSNIQKDLKKFIKKLESQ